MSISYPDSVLDRVLTPFTNCLTPEVARKVAEMRAEPEVQDRMDELADKANQGQLSAEETDEYDKYLKAFHLITVLQAKARLHLK